MYRSSSGVRRTNEEKRLSHQERRPTRCPSLSSLGKSKPVPTLRMGQISLTLANDLESTQVVRIERTIDRSGIVTAAAASTHARFRELFPEQAFRSDVPVATDELSLFACDVNNVEHLYATLGDNVAYHRIQMLQVEIQVAVNEYHGAVVKSIGEGLLASFQECANAVQAAIAIHERIAQCPILSCIELGIGIHSGRTLISTQNGRLDYFGITARTVANMAKRAGKDIVLTETVFTDAITQQTIKTHKVTSAIVPLDVPGLTHQVAQRISIKN